MHVRLSASFAGCLLVFALILHPSQADGPKDNVPDNVRPVPPRGTPIADADRQELLKGLNELGQEIEATRSALASQPELLELMSDVEIYHQAVRYAVTYNEMYNDKKRDDVKGARDHLKTGMKRAKELRDGNPSWTKATGLVVRGYRSKIDGSPQPYGLIVPKDYDFAGAKKHRLDFWWHGRGELLTELDFIRQRQTQLGQFTPESTLVLHPYGRYCNANKLAGEIDTLECLEHVRKHYRIDDSRIAARGFSMGGAACWQFAVHYPTLFAASAPGAGFSETPEFLNVFQNEKVEPTWYEQKLWRMYNATESALNIFNIPTIAYSGEIDRQKQAADVMAREMKKVGLTLPHLIGPKTGHSYHPETKKELDRQFDALMAKGKPAVPAEIQYVTYSLRYPDCGWVSVQGLTQHWEAGTVRGKVNGKEYQLTTSGVTALTLRTPVGAELKVDGQTFSARGEQTHLRKVEGKWQVVDTHDTERLQKRPGLQGPIDDAFLDRFVMVKPTGQPMNERIGKWVNEEMKHAVTHWRSQYRGDAPVKADTEITADDIQNANLILWGDPKSNAILARIADKLPLKEFGDSTVQLLIYPNPLNPKKYVVLNSGFTFREYDYLNNARQVPKLPDYAVIDVTTPANSRYSGKVVRAGFFGENWQVLPNDGK